jgi:hypothetical protein
LAAANKVSDDLFFLKAKFIIFLVSHNFWY